MTVREALRLALKMLETAKIDSPALTAEVLIRHVLKITRVQLFQEPNLGLTTEQESAFFNLIRRHIQGEPAAYLTGHKEFYGLDFQTDNRVLIPRPETELMVEQVLKEAGKREIDSVADIGTGSGVIAVTLAVHLKGAMVFAVDSSREAITVAQFNSSKHGVADRINFLVGDLASPLPEPVDLIAANLPYVKTADLTNPTIRFEPQAALDGGADGLETIRRFIPQTAGKLRSGGSVFIEIGAGQSGEAISILKQSYPEAKIKVHKDYNNIERMVTLTP